MSRGRGRGSWVPKAVEPGVVERPASPTGSVSSLASSVSSGRLPPGFGRGEN